MFSYENIKSTYTNLGGMCYNFFHKDQMKSLYLFPLF